MTSVQLLIDRVGNLRRVLMPKKSVIRMLPDIWIDAAGNDWPDHEQENAKARRYADATGLGVREYICSSEWNPDMDGCEV